MKKFIFAIILLCSTIILGQEKETTQTENQKKHEIKGNALSLIAFKWMDVSYEYLINKESSIGIGTLISLDSELDDYKSFSLTPYYRRYFSKNYAKGFFVEGFGMLRTYEDYYGSNQKNTDFSLGISTGGKFITKNGFVAEIYLGLGRVLFGETEFGNSDIVGRAGISLGYRF